MYVYMYNHVSNCNLSNSCPFGQLPHASSLFLLLIPWDWHPPHHRRFQNTRLEAFLLTYMFLVSVYYYYYCHHFFWFLWNECLISVQQFTYYPSRFPLLDHSNKSTKCLLKGGTLLSVPWSLFSQLGVTILLTENKTWVTFYCSSPMSFRRQLYAGIESIFSSFSLS